MWLRLRAMLAALLAVLLGVLLAPAQASADPATPPFVGIGPGDPRWSTQIPNLIYRMLHSGESDEVSYGRNVATDFVPDFLDGKTLAITGASVDMFPAKPKADGTEGHTDTSIIQLMLFDPATGTFELVGWDYKPLMADGKAVDWRAFADPAKVTPAARAAVSSLGWNIRQDTAAIIADPAKVARIMALLKRWRMHSEMVTSAVAQNIDEFTAFDAAKKGVAAPAPVGDLDVRVTKVGSEKIPCAESCGPALKGKDINPNADEVTYVTDLPTTKKSGKKNAGDKTTSGTDPPAAQIAPEVLKPLVDQFTQDTRAGKYNVAVPAAATQLSQSHLFTKAGNKTAPSAVDQALSGKDPGGIDLSSLQLRYLSEAPDGGLQYAFDANALKAGDAQIRAGREAAYQSSDAFFVWLSLPESTFWVNLNPTEPDRIVEKRLGSTDVGRILLEADYRMKSVVGKLIHPDTKLGKEFWGRIVPGAQPCISMRQWIVPKPASVYEQDGGLYILDAPLEVKMEADYLKSQGSGGKDACAKSDARMVKVFRDKVLPKVEEAVNKGTDFADLRRVYLSRVAAEWYRTKHPGGNLAKMINSGDVTQWPARKSWSSRDVFDAYVKSYNRKEFNVKRRETVGNYIYEVSYTYGGVDFSNVDLKPVAQAAFGAQHPGVTDAVAASGQKATADKQGRMWLGGTGYPVAQPKASPPVKKTNTMLFAFVGVLVFGLILGVIIVGVLASRRRRRT
ncbi:hypothetical protein [Micromonospora carbonacea]|uniref:Uncharacterized protein n=1 Tax=Micromonospora carbonacea TaxID=47853 RepID=A0A1C4YF86_9ACTN|nr:hypothetical protein [Micromonospora carbonacea]SCF19383.1 hypothetical protein GA0070563_10682 [Micromonospora carbonacea]